MARKILKEDRPDCYNELSNEVQERLLDWIKEHFEPGARYYRNQSSYALKHDFQRDTGIYIYNGAFKGAMLEADFAVENVNEQNWIFKMRKRIPDGFYGWCLKHYKGQSGPEADLAADMASDPNFPKLSKSKGSIEFYLRSKHACPEAVEVFHKVWAEYKDYRASRR